MPSNHWSRREFLQASIWSSLALVQPVSWAQDNLSSNLPLITKPIPATGEALPVIGLGTIWYRDAQFAQLKSVIQRLAQLGGSVIDTAAAYGESEGVVGRSLADLGLRDSVFIASKFDSGSMQIPGNSPAAPSAAPAQQRAPMPGPPEGVSRPGRDGVAGTESFERSLQRLQTNQIDLMQVHGMNGTDSLMPLLQEWKQDGRIRYLGVTTSSVNQHEQLIATMRQYPLDFIQVDYSIGNRNAEQGVFDAAQELGVAVLVNLPLGRATLLQKLADQPLPDWAAQINVTSWAQFLLKYVVSHPAVTCAIPGTTSVSHLEDNMLAARGVLPDAAIRRRMEELWATL